MLIISASKAISILRDNGASSAIAEQVLSNSLHGVLVNHNKAFPYRDESKTREQKALIQRYGRGSRDFQTSTDGLARWRVGTGSTGYHLTTGQQFGNPFSCNTGWEIWEDDADDEVNGGRWVVV